MRQITLWLLIFSSFLSCKKEKEYVVNPPKFVQLKIDQVINDSTIVLKWSKYAGHDFLKYKITREAYYLKNGEFKTFTDEIDVSYDINQVTFTENNMPFAKEINYNLIVIKDNPINRLDSIQSRSNVYYRRPNSLLTGNPVDILINRQKKWLYITEQQRIMLVDYSTGRQLTSKEFPNKIGYCSLGDFNGSNEVYVPVHDGTLHILDATTLQLKEKIYVGGLAIGSVVAANGKLYVSSTDGTDAPDYRYIKVYDRATKTLTARGGHGANTRLLLLEGTSVEMVDMTNNYSPYDLRYYKYSPNGTLIAEQRINYVNYENADPTIMRSFPDGSKFITSSSGSIYSKPLNFERNISNNRIYFDFAFNNDASVIYAAATYQKRIDAISYPAISTIKSYKTSLNPFRIFRDGNTLISLGTVSTYGDTYFMIIEKINL